MPVNDEAREGIPAQTEPGVSPSTSADEELPGAPMPGPSRDSSDGSTAENTTSEPKNGVAIDELAAMTSALERFHARAEQYESIIRRMQTRIEELQADQVRELLKPVILKLASLHTEATTAQERASTFEDDSVRKDFDFFVSEIEEALGLLDIESIGVSMADEFDAGKHAARRRIDTDDPALDRRIAKVLRQGFAFVGAERVLLPAMVNVYRYAPSVQSETASVAAASPETN
ncbi:nucleotide exchange factor GrpE [Mycolicibacterium llatzerense]|uniref:nucleotide exchange factor GrpE n=1 Tax=Mycolicibacterium llatzerense TaxID=280871 RepID=UPI00195513D8|nr:nucleotide exchange factor GrpE [Mycolicibacterium llatzerense]